MRHSLWQMHRLWRDTSVAPRRKVLDESSIKPSVVFEDPLAIAPYDISWSDCWVRHQLESQPRELYFVLQEAEATRNDIPIMVFISLWREVSILASISEPSIDSIVAHLLNKKLISIGDDARALSGARNLVFAIIGWQTMWYRPDMGSCPRNQLAVVDETGGYREYAYMKLRQEQSASRKGLDEFLLGFGVLLPCRDFSAVASDDDKKALATIKVLSADTFNAYLLTTVGGIRIQWTDSLACHLEVDADSKTLYLFRFPTFCSINLLVQENDKTKTTLHSCAASPGVASLWATHDEVNDLLRETLLSYRLLFGQNKASRQLFRSLTPFEDLPNECSDYSLSALCYRKQSNHAIRLRELDIPMF